MRGIDNDIFITYDSVVNHIGMLSFSMISVEKFVMFRKTDRKKVFWGEDIPPTTEDNIIDIKCVRAQVIYGGEPYDFYFPIPKNDIDDCFLDYFKSGNMLRFSAMCLEKTEKKGKDRVKVNAYFVNKFDIYEDDYADVTKVIPKIKNFNDLVLYKDYKTRQPIYEDIVNKIILYNIYYVKSGEPVFNLVLSGVSGVGKSWCVDVYMKAYGKVDKMAITASISTSKGFVPNFGEKVPRPGMLLDPRNFVKGAHEIFRGVCSAGRSGLRRRR